MPRRLRSTPWAKPFQRALKDMSRLTVKAGKQAFEQAVRDITGNHKPPPGNGEWIAGQALGAGGMRRYRLFKPPRVRAAERLPLVVMLHGCGQDASTFAASTRMNRIAARERFFVLYPEQDRRANPQGCWNWYGTRSLQAHGEAATLLAAIDQACLLYPVDASRIALVGLSAGASMAALLATRHPPRFKAVVMHSGVPPGSADSTVSAVRAMRGQRVPPAPPAGNHWPPLLVIHGSADVVVSPKNARAAAQLWAQDAGARAMQSRRVARGERYAMNVTDFKTGTRTIARLCEVQGLGHAWSGGDGRQRFSDARGPDAARMAWSFIVRQFRAPL